jgi:hypothetical protein
MPAKDETEKLLAPLFPVFWGSIRQAFSRFFEVNQDELGAIHNRTKASYINDLVIKNLKETLPSSSSPIWQNEPSQRRVILAGSVCLRAKKVGRDLNPKNLATQAQFDFYESMMDTQRMFPNMHSPIPLVLGFTVNPTKTAPDKVFLIYADGVLNRRRTMEKMENIKPKIKWVIPVPDTEAGTPSANLPLIPPAQPDGTMPRRVRTKVKKNTK